jgi:hypothetical protein
VGKLQGKRPLGRHQDVGGWIILKLILGWGGMDWIGVAEDRDEWRTPVNTAMNLRVP